MDHGTYSAMQVQPTQPPAVQQPTDGVSAGGVLTLLVVAGIAVALKVTGRRGAAGRGRGRGKSPEADRKRTGSGKKNRKQDPDAAPADLPVVGMEELRGDASVPGPAPEKTPAPVREKGREILGAPAAKAWAHKLDIPYELAQRIGKSAWTGMCSGRGLAGLERGEVEKTPYGVAVHVAFRGRLDFASVQRSVDQLETGLDVASGTIRLRKGATAGRGIVDIRLRDPLADGVPWEGPRTPVRLAHPMRLAVTPFGDTIELDLRQRIGVFGTSGSGKSCVQRLIGAHVAQAIDAELELWDMKLGVEAQHYAGKARQVTSIDAAVSRLDWLLDSEYPRRAAKLKERGVSEWKETPWDPALVIVIDEGSAIVRGFGEWRGEDEDGQPSGPKGLPLKRLFTAVEQGRALGVTWVWASQYPKATNLPTEIRSQLNVRICLKLESSEEAAVVFKDDVRDGWAPHDLLGPGWLLVKSATHRAPVDAKAVWLSTDSFRAVPVGGTVPDREPLPSRTAGQSVFADGFVRDSSGDSGTGQDRGQLDRTGQGTGTAGQDRTGVSLAIYTVLAFCPDPLSLSELARRAGCAKSTAHAALKRMTEEDQVYLDGDGYRLRTTDADTV